MSMARVALAGDFAASDGARELGWWRAQPNALADAQAMSAAYRMNELLMNWTKPR
jgi:hypothetical protein